MSKHSPKSSTIKSTRENRPGTEIGERGREKEKEGGREKERKGGREKERKGECWREGEGERRKREVSKEKKEMALVRDEPSFAEEKFSPP